MQNPERIREIANSLLANSSDPQTALSAGQLLKLAAEIDNELAGAQKLSAEEVQLRLNIGDFEHRKRSEESKAYITLLAPIFTTVILAGTLALQSFQFFEAEKDKRIEAKRLSDAAEDQRWSDAIKLLAQSEQISTADALLKSFARSDRYAEQAYRTALQILVKTDDNAIFSNLFSSVFNPVDWGNVDQLFDLSRSLRARTESEHPPLFLLNPKDLKYPVSPKDVRFVRLSPDQVSYWTNTKLVSSKIGEVLRSSRPKNVNLDFKGTKMFEGDFRNADLSRSVLTDADFEFINLDGADLSGITEFGRAVFGGCVWWRATKIDSALLKYLEDNYPYNPDLPYSFAWDKPTSETDYQSGKARLEKQTATEATPPHSK